ncbi:MAG: hypothetical protein MR904_00755 [Clostridia bacterium]|nr:hypothetical protein [Clostridia bacterium]
MREQLKCLYKKDILEIKNKIKTKQSTYGKFGYFLYFLFMSLLLVSGLILYIALSKGYVNNSPDNMLKRQSELLTITFAVVLIINIFTAVKNIYKKIVSNNDMEKYSILPIKANTLFVYKLTSILFWQLISGFLTVLPFGIVFGVICHQTAMFYFCLVLTIFIVPLIAIAIACVLVVPYYYIKRFMQARYVALIFTYSALMAGLIFVYGKFLNALNNLLVSGNLNNFFDERKYKIIEKISNFAFPANFLSNFLLGNNRFVAILILLLFTLLGAVIVVFAFGKFFNYLSKNSYNNNKAFKAKKNTKKCGWFISLFNKEIKSIIRTPSYAFSLFGMAIDLPILVLLCTRLLSGLVKNLVYLDLGYQIAFFVLCMFALLTNTFCASCVSREGKNFYNLKLLPLTNFQILLPKITLCFIVSSFSVLVSSFVLVGYGYITIWQALGITFVVECLSLAENLFATKYDLIHPVFTKNAKGEPDTATPSSNICLILSFFVTIILVGIIILYSIFNLLKGNALSKFMLYILPLIIAMAVLALSILFFAHNLNKGGARYEK